MQELSRHPDGTRIALAARGGVTNSQMTFGSGGVAVPALAALVGKSLHGTWKIVVSDGAAHDVSTLTSYQLLIQSSDARASEARTVSLTQTPNQPVPDLNAAGLSRDLFVADTGVIDSVSVHLELKGSVVNDLVVSLITPSGSEIALASRNLPSAVVTLGDGGIDAPGLAQLVGSSAHGRWTVKIADMAAHDVSTLANVTLSLRIHGGAAADQVAPVIVDQPFNVVIPDFNTTGVSLSFFVPDQETIDDVGVHLQLSGGVANDLNVTLVHPDGTRVTLAQRNLPGLDATFGDGGTSLRALDGLQGKPIRGSWQLVVSDGAAHDVSTLTHLTLTIRPRAP